MNRKEFFLARGIHILTVNIFKQKHMRMKHWIFLFYSEFPDIWTPHCINFFGTIFSSLSSAPLDCFLLVCFSFYSEIGLPIKKSMLYWFSKGYRCCLKYFQIFCNSLFFRLSFVNNSCRKIFSLFFEFHTRILFTSKNVKLCVFKLREKCSSSSNTYINLRRTCCSPTNYHSKWLQK